MRYTPGSWSFEPEKTHNGVHIAGRGPMVFVDGKELVRFSGKNAAADAMLCAAAPSLLKALENALLCMEDHVECMCWEADAKAAIRKAKTGKAAST